MARRLVIALIALGSVVGTSAFAHASSTLTIGAKGGMSDLVDITASFDGDGGKPESMLAGTLTGSVNGGPSFDAYCVDLYHVVYIDGDKGTSTYLVNPLPISSLTGGNGAGVGYLYDQFAPMIAKEADGASKNIDGAALQVAIWKVEYDNGGPLTSGHFTMSDSSDPNSVQHQVFVRATQFLSAYNGTQSGDATWFQAVTHPVVDCVPTNQNMIGPVSCPPPPVPTPEPSTFVAVAIGAAGLLAYSRRDRRRAGVAGPASLT